jgi:hypothetical protein
MCLEKKFIQSIVCLKLFVALISLEEEAAHLQFQGVFLG